jgi:uncharacterized membrane protein HdeD (DUF308 family)
MSMSRSAEDERLQLDMGQAAFRQHWVWFLVEGIVLLILGVLAVVIPSLATLAFTVFFSYLFVISGVFGLVTTFGARGAPGFWWSLLSGTLALAIGIMMILLPVSGAISFTLLLTAFFIVDGVASIMYALAYRQQFADRWGWLLAIGVCDLVLAAIIIAGFPGTAVWALGLLIGIDMIFSGTTLIILALYAKASAIVSANTTTGVAYPR